MKRILNPLIHCGSDEQRRLLTAASRATLSAGILIKSRFDQPHTLTMKGTINLVTETDLMSEAAIITSLETDTPGLPVMAEESTKTHSQEERGRFWVVDPLDGTTNFAHGFPYFAVSIALLDHGRPLVAAVYAPMSDELFVASKDGGAWLNDRPIKVSRKERLIEALIGTGFPYELEQTLPDVMRQLAAVLPSVRDIRRAGAAALDLAYLACGRLDGFYEMNLQPWDTAAGWLLIEEAGGRVSDFSGDEYSPFRPRIVASNGLLHPSLLQLLL